MGKRWMIAIAAVMMVLGLGVLLYPTVSSTVNQLNGSYAIQEFQQQLDTMGDREKEAALDAARAYNVRIQASGEKLTEENSGYYNILDFGNGIMGYISIPKINVKLPIYHGVSNEVLEKGIGHLPTSSFPVAGNGNHSVLTGHTGLPSASLFTELDMVQEGDRFHVTVGNTDVTYQVDQIKVVLPNETDDLQSVPGADYCTLVTCTPYGVNSHRLLVRGERVEITEESSDDGPIQQEPEVKDFNAIWLLCLLPFGVILLWKRKWGKS